MAVGGRDDTFTVYRGNPSYNNDPNAGDPLDGPPVWRYSARNALESPSVPAVEQFEKAVAKTEKVYDGH